MKLQVFVPKPVLIVSLSNSTLLDFSTPISDFYTFLITVLRWGINHNHEMSFIIIQRLFRYKMVTDQYILYACALFNKVENRQLTCYFGRVSDKHNAM